MLARAVAAGAITRNEAALIGSTRLEPISLAEVAVLRGQSYRDVRAARIRAERKLSMFLREQDTGSIDTFLTRHHRQPRTTAARTTAARTTARSHTPRDPAATGTGTRTSPSGSRRTGPNHREGRVDVPGGHRAPRGATTSSSRGRHRSTTPVPRVDARLGVPSTVTQPGSVSPDPPTPQATRRPSTHQPVGRCDRGTRTERVAASHPPPPQHRSHRAADHARIRQHPPPDRHRSTDTDPDTASSGSQRLQEIEQAASPPEPAATVDLATSDVATSSVATMDLTMAEVTWRVTPGAALTPRTRADQRPVTTGVARTVLVLVVLAVVMFGAVASAPAHAQDTEVVLALAQSVDELLNNIRNWIVGILAGLATVFLTIGGARYTMAGGDPGEVERAREALRSAARGYALAALAPLIVEILKGLVGA